MALPASPTPANDAAHQPAAGAQYYRDVLHELIGIGMDMARALPGQARAQADAAEAASAASTDHGLALDLSVVFDRISRAIRRTIVLARRLDEPVVATGQRADRAAARRGIIRGVEDAIQRVAREGGEAESLHAEFVERLDGPDLDDDIDQRPVAAIVADICRDLGIATLPGAHPWKRRTPADIAELCALAARPSAADAPERFFRLVASPARAEQ